MNKDVDQLLHENCFSILLKEKPVHRIKDKKENLELYSKIIQKTTDLYVAIQEKRSLEEISEIIKEKKEYSLLYKRLTSKPWRL